jgi:ferredoxin
VKNLFGCIPGLIKPEMHLRFPEKDRFARMLVDLALLVKPGITLVDGVDSMEGDGPAGGTVRHTAMTFAGRNVFALDLALGAFIGLRPGEIPTVAESVKSGLCPDDPAELTWLLDGRPEPTPHYKHPASKSVRFSGHAPKLFRPLAAWAETKFSPRPVVSKKKCIGCGKCAESCAPKAMTIREKKASLDLSKCIRCYCCHEMCPVKAIRIRRIIG